jgi:hypothetical protein
MLRRIIPYIAPAEEWRVPSIPAWLGIAFSYQGLKALGLPQASLDSFPEEFRQGMAARAEILRDIGDNAPANWEYPFGTSDAEDFIVEDRLASLENYVNLCLPTLHDKTESSGYAPFPAIMYCFSIIDLMGSLYVGNARHGNTTDNSKIYREVFELSKREGTITTENLPPQPKPAMLYNKQIIAWKHDEKELSKHLTVVPTSGDVYLPGKLGRIHCDAQYIVSIRVLKDDIKILLYALKMVIWKI